MFDFFVPKNISCVFLISPEKYFAFFETGEGLSIESGEGASHCSTGSREGSSVKFSVSQHFQLEAERKTLHKFFEQNLSKFRIQLLPVACCCMFYMFR